MPHTNYFPDSIFNAVPVLLHPTHSMLSFVVFCIALSLFCFLHRNCGNFSKVIPTSMWHFCRHSPCRAWRPRPPGMMPDASTSHSCYSLCICLLDMHLYIQIQAHIRCPAGYHPHPHREKIKVSQSVLESTSVFSFAAMQIKHITTPELSTMSTHQ